MTYQLNAPLKPTWARYRKIFLENFNISTYRALEYEALRQIRFEGKILDFGGGNKAHYLNALKKSIKNGQYESVNISEDMEPTFHVEPQAKLPIDDDAYDMVLSVNTLEHVYELEKTLIELVRVLKPGGRVVWAVPFLFRMHGCPDDFNRPTISWWSAKLSELGLTQLQFTPLVWDVMTTGFSVTEGAGPFKKLRKLLVPLCGLCYAKLRASGPSDRYPLPVGQQLSNWALGYIITGVKNV